ncbi:hypothetical protein ElyMa_007024800, partial [Elysia marginata]
MPTEYRGCKDRGYELIKSADWPLCLLVVWQIRRTYADAKRYCESREGALVEIMGKSFQKSIQDSVHHKDVFWIGFRYSLKTGEFRLTSWRRDS